MVRTRPPTVQAHHRRRDRSNRCSRPSSVGLVIGRSGRDMSNGGRSPCGVAAAPSCTSAPALVQPHHRGRSRFISPSDPAGLRMTSRSGQPGCTPPPGPIGRHAVSHPSAGRHRRRGPHRVAGPPRPGARPRLPGHRPRSWRHRPARRLRPPRCRALLRAARPPTGPARPCPPRCRAARGLRCGPDRGVPRAAGGRCRRPVARHAHRGRRPPCRCLAVPGAGGRSRGAARRGEPRSTGRAPAGRHPHGHAGRRPRPAGGRAARSRGGRVVDRLDARPGCRRPGRGRLPPGPAPSTRSGHRSLDSSAGPACSPGWPRPSSPPPSSPSRRPRAARCRPRSWCSGRWPPSSSSPCAPAACSVAWRLLRMPSPTRRRTTPSRASPTGRCSPAGSPTSSPTAGSARWS